MDKQLDAVEMAARYQRIVDVTKNWANGIITASDGMWTIETIILNTPVPTPKSNFATKKAAEELARRPSFFKKMKLSLVLMLLVGACADESALMRAYNEGSPGTWRMPTQTDYAYWRANPVPMAPDPTQRPTPIGTTPIEAASQLPAPIIVNNYGYQPPPFRTGASTFTVDGPAGIAFGTFYPATEINQ